MTKERELNAFLDAFPQRKAAKQDELSAKAEAITTVLERLNKLQASTGAALPNQGQFQEMKVRRLTSMQHSLRQSCDLHG